MRLMLRGSRGSEVDRAGAARISHHFHIRKFRPFTKTNDIYRRQVIGHMLRSSPLWLNDIWIFERRSERIRMMEVTFGRVEAHFTMSWNMQTFRHGSRQPLLAFEGVHFNTPTRSFFWAHGHLPLLNATWRPASFGCQPRSGENRWSLRIPCRIML